MIAFPPRGLISSSLLAHTVEWTTLRQLHLHRGRWVSGYRPGWCTQQMWGQRTTGEKTMFYRLLAGMNMCLCGLLCLLDIKNKARRTATNSTSHKSLLNEWLLLLSLLPPTPWFILGACTHPLRQGPAGVLSVSSWLGTVAYATNDRNVIKTVHQQFSIRTCIRALPPRQQQPLHAF